MLDTACLFVAGLSLVLVAQADEKMSNIDYADNGEPSAWVVQAVEKTNAVDYSVRGDRKKALLLQQLQTEYNADLLEVDDLLRANEQILHDEQRLKKRYDEIAFEKDKCQIVPIFDANGRRVGEREIVTPLTANQQIIRKIVRLFSGDESRSVREIYERYSGKSADTFIREFKDEYMSLDEEYAKVTKKLEKLNDDKSTELASLRKKYRQGRSVKVKVLESHIADIEGRKEDVTRNHKYNLCESRMIQGRNGEMIKSCKCQQEIDMLDDELYDLRQQMRMYEVVDAENTEIGETADIEQKYDKEMQSVQTEYTHKVALKEVVDKYRLKIEKDIFDEMKRRYSDNLQRIRTLSERNEARLNFIEGRVELTRDIINDYYKKIQNWSIERSGIIEVTNEDEKEDGKCRD